MNLTYFLKVVVVVVVAVALVAVAACNNNNNIIKPPESGVLCEEITEFVVAEDLPPPQTK